MIEKRDSAGANNVAVLRIEQLYPFPTLILKEILSRYHHVNEFIWCQEEPMNQGAWYNSQHHFKACMPAGKTNIEFAGRPASAAPAVGYTSLHNEEQAKLVAEALGITE